MSEIESKKSIHSDSIGNKSDYQFIIACLRVRRMLHVLAKSSGKKFEPTKTKKIVEDIQSVRKRLDALK